MRLLIVVVVVALCMHQQALAATSTDERVQQLTQQQQPKQKAPEPTSVVPIPNFLQMSMEERRVARAGHAACKDGHHCPLFAGMCCKGGNVCCPTTNPCDDSTNPPRCADSPQAALLKMTLAQEAKQKKKYEHDDKRRMKRMSDKQKYLKAKEKREQDQLNEDARKNAQRAAKAQAAAKQEIRQKAQQQAAQAAQEHRQKAAEQHTKNMAHANERRQKGEERAKHNEHIHKGNHEQNVKHHHERHVKHIHEQRRKRAAMLRRAVYFKSRKDRRWCLFVRRTRNGERVRMYPCRNHPNWRWVVDGYLIRSARDMNYCIDSPASWRNGRPIHLWRCNKRNANQRWRLQGGGRIFKVHTSKFVLDMPRKRGHAPVHLWSWHGGSNQRWIWTRSYRTPKPPGYLIRSRRHHGYCLYVSRLRNGQRVRVHPCRSNDVRFRWRRWGRLIRNGRYNYCIDSPRRNNGGRIHIWHCNHHNRNQQWSYNKRGQFRLLRTSKTLDMPRLRPGHHVHLWQRHHGSNQRWFFTR
eukprot:TRINITY_DN65686_c9_g3_i1.p1 TRINITY_DN65686_c9_g3~~TRINITY_DN65686_c9_g3_i1.p1  ORF type:complete len:522 (-),score=271.81 TRINITY_DN65686_c9_g3_i1:71-1636(-)